MTQIALSKSLWLLNACADENRMGSYACCRSSRYHLKAEGHSVPVIYMTASDNPAVREAALGSGCIAFLTKPFSTQELIEPLKEAAAGRS